MNDTTNVPAIGFPSAATVEQFLESAAPVLAPFSGVPQVAFVSAVVVPILEGALKIVAQLQSSQTLDAAQLQSLISTEIHNIANAIHPPTA